LSPYVLLDPFVRAGYSALTGIATLLPGPTGGAALATGIAAVTLLLRAALLPVSVSTFRAQRARAALAPELAALRRRHRGAELAAELTAAYRRAGIRPAADLLPLLVQALAIASLYRIIVAATIAGHANAILGATVLGAPLAGHWPAILGTAGAGPVAAFAVLVAALVVLAWASARLTARQAPGTGRLLRLLPYGTPAFAVLAPAAVGVYLLISTAWTLAERAALPHLVR
jgi:YidC/Oxa1 family membrane protein insertase